MEKPQEANCSFTKIPETLTTNMLSRSMDGGRLRISKGLITRRNYIFAKKKNSLSPSSKPLEIQCKEAIHGQTGIDSKALIEQIYCAIKTLHQGQPTIHSLESLNNCVQLVLKSTLLFNLVNDNYDNIKLIVYIVCSKEGSLSKVNLLCFSILDVISSSFLFKNNLIEIEFIHKFLNSLLEDEISPEQRLRILKIIINLMKFKENTSYIPGETLVYEQHRANMIQFGVLITMIYLSKDSNCDIKNLAQEHLGANYFLQELEWGLKMVLECLSDTQRKGLSEEQELLVNSTYLSTIPRPRMQLSQYLDLWNGKHLILSPQYRELVRKGIAADLKKFIKIRRQHIEFLGCKKLRKQLKKRKKVKKLKEDIESEIWHTEEINTVFKRYDHIQQVKINLFRQDILEKQRQILHQENKNKKYLEQAQKQPEYIKQVSQHILTKASSVSKKNLSALRSDRRTIFTKDKKSGNISNKYFLNEINDEVNETIPPKYGITPTMKQLQSPSSVFHRADMTIEEKAAKIYSIYHNKSFTKKALNLVKPTSYLQGHSARYLHKQNLF